MAPRRSLARNTATPARSTRGGSVNLADSSISRRVTRGSSQQPSVKDDVVNNPQLPNVQTQQSYAYGSTKTPLLPEQLLAKDNLSLNQMAETIDAGVRQAGKRFEEHAIETRGQLGTSPQPERALRSSSKSKTSPPEPLKTTDAVDVRKKDMVAAWADSLESSHLDDIEEEEFSVPSSAGSTSRRDTDPSSFPSGIFDHSYNYERGIRKPVKPTPQQNQVNLKIQAIRNRAKLSYRATLQWCRDALYEISQWLFRLLNAIKRSVLELPDSSILSTVVKLIAGLCLASGFGYLFCLLYTTRLCDPTTTSFISTNLRSLCGSCSSTPPMLNLSGDDIHNHKKVSAALHELNERIFAHESRLASDFDAKHSSLQTEVNALKHQYKELSTHMSKNNHDSAQTDIVASPLIAKMNFFAPSNGAIVNPYLTSPTLHKPFPFIQRVAMRMLGLSKHQSKAPITALEAWNDVGDCWCGSNLPITSRNNEDIQDSVRLAVTVRELMYPIEFVIEHYPADGSLNPGTAPKSIEIWADFSHLDADQFSKLNIQQKQDTSNSSRLPKGYLRIGRATYDVSAPEHVQSFKLNVNQYTIDRHTLPYYAQHFIVRVTENYGSEHTCLYRIRLHGLPTPETGQT